MTYLQNHGDPKKTVYTLKISRAIRGVTYRDTISGKTFTGEELRKGIPVESDTEGLYAVCGIWSRNEYIGRWPNIQIAV